MNIRNLPEMEPRKQSIPDPSPRFTGLDIKTKLYIKARWRWVPFYQLYDLFPSSGNILDFGCGFGFLSYALALQHPSRQVIGIDHDIRRISAARAAFRDVTNLSFHSEPLSTFCQEKNSLSAVAAIDVFHYLSQDQVQESFELIHKALIPGGKLIFREVDKAVPLFSSVAALHEFVMTRTGMTKSDRVQLMNKEHWETLCKKTGFLVKPFRWSRPLFSDTLFCCEKT